MSRWLNHIDVEERDETLTVDKSRYYTYGVTYLFLPILLTVTAFFYLLFSSIPLSLIVSLLVTAFPFELKRRLGKAIIQIDKDKLQASYGRFTDLRPMTIDRDCIEQLYVFDTGRGYSLRILLYDGKVLNLLDRQYWRKAEDAIELEKKLESFMGIKNYRIGEELLQAEKNTLKHEKAIGEQRALDAANVSLANVRQYDLVEYRAEEYEVVFETQYDWDSGYTDKLFRLVSANRNILLHRIRNQHASYLFEEVRSFEDRELLSRFAQIGQKLLEYKGAEYYKIMEVEGRIFPGQASISVHAVQLIYLSPRNNCSLRFLKERGCVWQLFRGKRVDESAFYALLPGSKNDRERG